MIIRKLRLQRGWSQEQLAEMSGLSVRTIQRLERGQKAGLESLKSLAAVFDVELSNLYEDTEMKSAETIESEEVSKLEQTMTWEEQQAMEYVRDVKGFYSSLMTFLVVVPALFLLNYFTSPGHFWAWWVLFGWGIGIIAHALSVFEVFNFFGADWEKKQVEKRIGRKL